ncbi:TPA: hypothetical protein HA235_03860 [Candidatus Woesearchaeota archaeon]|nr:hypothetical protein [uncultured archaeon]MBS3173312.1 hypothetical protein [Candidatus Woesearchaeota archaeon]HIH31818.1 hypothetical protein [Candidatus Woesearchaeota archaeon]HIH55467.1 hypothetical protein [Candidatus Woesearchaeota archaeon]HIJ01891.1 hypothetical protein [Candidatus Woesearchaeota archaeon]
MTWNPTSHAKNIAVLVVNRDHSRFSQLGQLIAHDWKEYGTLFVKFEDGEDTFQDGLCAGDPVSPVRTYYHIRNEKGKDFDVKGVGPNSLKHDFMQFGFGDEQSFLEKYKKIIGADF